MARRRAILSFTAVIVAWELLASTGLINPFFYSSPTRIAAAFVEEVQLARFWGDVRITTMELAIGYVAAVATAIPFGIVTGASKRLGWFFRPWVDGLNATPRIALYPVVILWVGIGIWSKVVLVFLATFFAVAINTAAGVRTVDNRYLDVAKAYSAPKRWTFLTVVVPATVPFITTGMKIAVHRAVIGVIVAELFGSRQGLGYMIRVAGQNLQTDRLFVGALTFTLIGLLMFRALGLLESHFQRWRPST